MGTQKLYLAFGLFVITYYHCFKIPTFSLWKYCFFCGIHPAEQNAFFSTEGILKNHYSVIPVFSTHCEWRILKISVSHWGSTLAVHKGLSFFFLNFRFIKNNKRNCDIHSDVRLLTLMTMLFFFYLPLSKIAYINVLPGDHISNNKACVTYSSVTQCCNWEI